MITMPRRTSTYSIEATNQPPSADHPGEWRVRPGCPRRATANDFASRRFAKTIIVGGADKRASGTRRLRPMGENGPRVSPIKRIATRRDWFDSRDRVLLHFSRCTTGFFLAQILLDRLINR